ncbi:MAG: glucodextranase DOMON-like domain-containing protein [Anaerolineae bacterium]|jgi:alpha-amylase/alpha-mannosidase (GH57 family)
MRKFLRLCSLLCISVLLLSACDLNPEPTPTVSEAAPIVSEAAPIVSEAAPTIPPAVAPTNPPTAQPLYLAIIWHQHQPVYYKDPETGIYAKPWVRVHAAKDYVDMAAMLEQYPDIHVTFNLTPSLLRQIDDLAAGARDLYRLKTEIPAAELTDEDKAFIRDRFFDINPKIIARFPRYQEIADDRQNSENWDEGTWRDLQLLFNLGWTDPDWLAREPLAALVAQGRDFSEEDKALVLAEHQRLVEEVVPLHRRLQEAGQIEVTMTPYAHPILPLLIDTSLARVAQPKIDLPNRFSFPRDAVAQVERGVELYRQHFGADPRGMWPAEGAVAQEMVGIAGRNGLAWMASDEEVLAKSLEMAGFGRDSTETVQEADRLYRPYYVDDLNSPPVAIIFRDHVISDKVGFTYSGMDGQAAADDFLQRLHRIKDQLEAEGAQGPHLVSVILDGENAWEHYDNDGKTFLHSLYQGLSDDPQIETVTPVEFLALAPEQPQIETLWAGSWIGHDFSTWIGEEEENTAWNYLGAARELLELYIRDKRQASEEAIAAAMDAAMIAEGSDWFWWYGADQDSGSDEDFDRQFRDTLKQVYLALDEPLPDFLDVPVIPQRAQAPEQAATGLISPTIDGLVTGDEWATAGYYAVAGGAMARADDLIAGLAYGFDAQHLYLRFDLRQPLAEISSAGPTHLGLYMTGPGADAVSSFSRYGRESEPKTILGFGARYELSIDLHPDEVGAALYAVGEEGGWTVDRGPGLDAALAISPTVEGSVIEIRLPFAAMGPVDSGDLFQVRAVLSRQGRDVQVVPAAGPARMAVPDLGTTILVLEVDDPQGDDDGPGTYLYPTDGVFGAGAYDLTSFSVGYDEENIVFKFVVAGPVDNAWNSPNGLSIQTFDVYIDQDGPSSGARRLLPGRNAALGADYAWDYALWIEGWYPGIYVPGDKGPEQLDAQWSILVDPGQRKVTVRVPKEVLGDDPQNWSYTAVLLSQEGYPATGVWRVRDVQASAAQWRLGGAPADTNHTRIIDLAWPAGVEPDQATILGSYPPSQETNMDNLGADDFAQLPMIVPQ